MKEKLIKELNNIYEEHLKDLKIVHIKERIKQSKESYKREFEHYSISLINKAKEYNLFENKDIKDYIIKLQNKSKTIHQNFLDFL